MLGNIFKVFFDSFTSASSWNLVIFSQQKTGPGVMVAPSGDIENMAGVGVEATKVYPAG